LSRSPFKSLATSTGEHSMEHTEHEHEYEQEFGCWFTHFHGFWAIKTWKNSNKPGRCTLQVGHKQVGNAKGACFDRVHAVVGGRCFALSRVDLLWSDGELTAHWVDAGCWRHAPALVDRAGCVGQSEAEEGWRAG